jgi:multidrug efflux pump subunit AcrA (membrane-fusion protein)
LGDTVISLCFGQVKTARQTLQRLLLASAVAALLAACQKGVETAVPEARPVRTATVEKCQSGAPQTYRPHRAEDTVVLAFRISGRLLESKGKLGDRVQAGQVLATLENELNTLRQAQAGLAAAQRQLT